ncbi:hypothetical protein L861_11260 [Litchfieldella anticariensis FP35 = DSM 16096]|uniref:Carboxypeptidase regulatory-like domain-containing protein n=1 Tax=Litchfieldella anticariensis (strain DSM 16096 / CECT 5854 / CIP 108499 / LMG 22089 / FP35) TaxID=1121939 RepID=S2KGS3_LITA3|nr:hypothetical protein [Halomonas anticariensis]EPC01145.1 hypothetical protein L861_11260 [Halomonas anticariensis FP35 = DSM 16096]
MNRSNFVISLSLALMLGLGGVSHSLAMATPELSHNGVSNLRLVPTSYVDRYTLNVDSPTNIKITSASWGSIGVNMIIKARLLDHDDNVVSSARQHGGDFVITETLEPGRYVLEVEGQELSDRVQTNNRYSVRTITF